MKSDTDHASRQENPFRKVFKLYHKSLLSVFMGPPKYFPDSSVGKESTCNAGDPLIPGSGRSPQEEIGYPLKYSWALLVAQLVKESTCNAGDLGLIPGLQRSPGESNCYPLQYSGLENPMDCIVLGVTKSQT